MPDAGPLDAWRALRLSYWIPRGTFLLRRSGRTTLILRNTNPYNRAILNIFLVQILQQ